MKRYDKLKIIILFLVLSCALSCGRSNAIEPGTQQAATASFEQTSAPTASNKQLAVGPIEFFASWKASYVKLERWKDTSDPNVPHPEAFDILCPIENKGNSAIQEGDFIILTTIDFVVAPTYLHNGDVSKIVNEVGWGRVGSMDDIKLGIVPYLRPQDRAQIKIKGFNLGRVIKEFNGKEDTLWPWALRVNVRVLNRDMTPVALEQVVLPVIPADSRLAAK